MNAVAGLGGKEKALSICEVVEAHAAAAEEQRTLPAETVAALWQSGLFHHFNPVDSGGCEPDFRDMIDTWVEMARQDGSVGWIGIANCPSAAFASAYLPEGGFQAVLRDSGDRVTMAGQFAHNGLGTEVEGGYQLTGAWNFGSGTGHSAYVVGGFIPMRDGEMVMMDNDSGMPEMMVAVMPREQINFTDGWNVMGLCGTGSYDYNVEDVLVPAEMTFPLFTREPLRGKSPVFRMGVMPVTAAGHAAFAVGLGRRALDEVKQLAIEKTRMGDTSVQDRIDMRIAATYATEACKEVVDFAHQAAGTSAICDGNLIERIFRDMHTATQHIFIGEKTYTEAAKILLGLQQDSMAV